MSIETSPANESLNQASGIPNVVWSFWAQGTDHLPPVIQVCIDSWRQNAGVERIYVLDPISVYRFLDRIDLPLTFSSLTPQMQSDAVRLAVLAKYGGIWLDASTLVTKTLMPWVEKVSKGKGLFLFQNPPRGRGGRLFEIGFLAVCSGNEFFETWSREFNLFFSRKRIHLAHSPTSNAPWVAKKTFGLLNKWLRKTPSRSALWARRPLRLLPFYPYFITYYIANDLLLERGLGHNLRELQHIDSHEYLQLRKKIDCGEIASGLEEALLSDIPVHDVEFRRSFTNRELTRIRSVICEV